MAVLPPSEFKAADLVLLHGVGWLAANVVRDRAHRVLVVEALRDAIPRATVTIPMVADLASVARRLIEQDDARSRWDAMALLERIHMAKLAPAADAMRAGG